MKAIKIKEISKLLDRYSVDEVEQMHPSLSNDANATGTSGAQFSGSSCPQKNTVLKSVSKDERRRHFRIPFPLSDRPVLELDMETLHVADLSESGLRAKMLNGMTFEEDEEIVADLKIFDGTSYKVRGKVVRKHEYFLILQFEEMLPYSLIMNLQRHLMNKYELSWGDVA